jgi:hypothetical protein
MQQNRRSPRTGRVIPQSGNPKYRLPDVSTGVIFGRSVQAGAEAVAALGAGNTIFNYGTIRSDRAVAFFWDESAGTNTIIRGGRRDPGAEHYDYMPSR